LTPKLVILGHGNNGIVSLIAWTGTQYNLIQKAEAFDQNKAISEIRKDAFSSLPN
jgi:hypothetical protein